MIARILLVGAIVASITASCAALVGAGYFIRNAQYKVQLAEATAKFKEDVRLANEAYASQKVIDDAELAALKKEAETAPPDPTIAVKREMGKRIGAIR